jgi:hypothetical protein
MQKLASRHDLLRDGRIDADADLICGAEPADYWDARGMILRWIERDPTGAFRNWLEVVDWILLYTAYCGASIDPLAQARFAKTLFPDPIGEDVRDFDQRFFSSFSSISKQNLQTTTLHDARFHAFFLRLRWIECGLPTFELTHSLAASLMLTDPSRASPEFVRSPFHTFLVRLPSPFWDFVEADRHFDMTHLWVAHFCDAGGPHLMLMPTVRRGMPGISTLHAPIDSSVDLGRWLHERIDPPVGRPGDSEEFVQGNREKIALNEHLSRAARRLYANLCLYIADLQAANRLSLDIRPRNDRGRKCRRSGPNESPRTTNWVLGREIKLDSNLLEAARSWTGMKTGKRGLWSVHCRFTVVGHWRDQVCGKRKKLPDGTWTPWPSRRPTRIEPYWKGPSAGDLLHHLRTFAPQTSPDKPKPEEPQR